MPSDLHPLRRHCCRWQQSRQPAGLCAAVVGAKVADFLAARHGKLGSFRLRLCVKPPFRSGILVFFPPFLGSFCKTNPTLFFPNELIPKYIRIFQLGSFGKNRISYREPSRWEWRSRVGRDAVAANAKPKVAQRASRAGASECNSTSIQSSHE
jgi:hypothetical protein